MNTGKQKSEEEKMDPNLLSPESELAVLRSAILKLSQTQTSSQQDGDNEISKRITSCKKDEIEIEDDLGMQ